MHSARQVTLLYTYYSLPPFLTIWSKYRKKEAIKQAAERYLDCRWGGGGVGRKAYEVHSPTTMLRILFYEAHGTFTGMIVRWSLKP